MPDDDPYVDDVEVTVDEGEARNASSGVAAQVATLATSTGEDAAMDDDDDMVEEAAAAAAEEEEEDDSADAAAASNSASASSASLPAFGGVTGMGMGAGLVPPFPPLQMMQFQMMQMQCQMCS